MRIFKVKKIKELIEESGNDKDFMESEWVAVDDMNNLIAKLHRENGFKADKKWREFLYKWRELTAKLKNGEESGRSAHNR